MFKTLGKIRWEDIKIGEVFAYNGCWTIYCKTGKNERMFLGCDDTGHDACWCGIIECADVFYGSGLLYELPLEVQNLFITK